jgi:hypothetical protein
MKPDETGWNRMKPDETGWNQMKPDEFISDFHFWMKSGRDEVDTALNRFKNLLGRTSDQVQMLLDFLVL